MCLKVIDLLLIDSFSTAVRIKFVDTFGAVDRSACVTPWPAAIALGVKGSVLVAADHAAWDIP